MVVFVVLVAVLLQGDLLGYACSSVQLFEMLPKNLEITVWEMSNSLATSIICYPSSSFPIIRPSLKSSIFFGRYVLTCQITTFLRAIQMEYPALTGCVHRMASSKPVCTPNRDQQV